MLTPPHISSYIPPSLYPVASASPHTSPMPSTNTIPVSIVGAAGFHQ